MKKKNIIFCVLPLISSSLFAESANKVGAVTAALNFRVMDIPLLDGMSYFITTIGTFGDIAGKLAIALFLATLIWNAFRLWFGTQQVRKAAVDIMLKCLLFTAVFAGYRGIQVGVIDLAMKIGTNAGGGAAEVATTMSNLKENLESKLIVAQNTMKKMFKEAGDTGGALSETDVKNLAKGTGYSEEEVREQAEQYGVKINDSAATVAGKVFLYSGANSISSAVALGTLITVGIKNKLQYKKMYNNLNDEEVNNFKEMVKNGEGAKIQNLLAGFAEVMYENPDWENAPDDLKSNINKYIYSPFITTTDVIPENEQWSLKKWKKTGVDEGVMISPAALIKTCVLVANVIMATEENTTDENNQTSKKFFQKTWQDINRFIMTIIMVLGIIAAGVFCCIQYCMCIFEYWIVTSIGVLFIPCILFDGTKSYASKLIQLYVSFFIKITVMLLCMFWTFSTYINVATNILASANPVTMLNFAYILFALILGFVVTQNAPQIAMTILNGTPQLSMGEFIHAAGTAAAGAALAKKGATMAAKTAAPVVKGANAGIAEGASAAAGAWKGAGEAGAGFGTKFKMAAGAGIRQTASAWDSGIKDHASRLITGKESSSHNASSLHVGVGDAKTLDLKPENANKDGTLTNKNISEAYAAQAKKAAEAQKAKNAGNNPLPDEQAGKVSIAGSEQQSNLE